MSLTDKKTIWQKTWYKKDDFKIMQRYKLRRKIRSKWIVFCGLNPSSGIELFSDETNLRIINILYSSKYNKYKGYYLLNLSPKLSTNYRNLKVKDFKSEEANSLKLLLRKFRGRNYDLCIFYGKESRKRLTSDIIEELQLFFDYDLDISRLYLTVDSNENNTTFNTFTHPKVRNIGIRKVNPTDFDDIGFTPPINL